MKSHCLGLLDNDRLYTGAIEIHRCPLGSRFKVLSPDSGISRKHGQKWIRVFSAVSVAATGLEVDSEATTNQRERAR